MLFDLKSPKQNKHFHLFYSLLTKSKVNSVFFDYHNRCHETLITLHPTSGIIFVMNLNEHHVEWLSSLRTIRMECRHGFAALCSLRQLIQQPKLPVYLILNLIFYTFLTSNISQYSYKILSSIDPQTIS